MLWNELRCISALDKLLCTECLQLSHLAPPASQMAKVGRNTTQPATPKCTALYRHWMHCLFFLQKIEAGVGRVRKPQDRHIGIHSHLSARLPAPAGMWTWHWGWNKPASAVATYNGYIQGCIFLQQLHVLGRILLQQPQPEMYILTMVTN